MSASLGQGQVNIKSFAQTQDRQKRNDVKWSRGLCQQATLKSGKTLYPLRQASGHNIILACMMFIWCSDKNSPFSGFSLFSERCLKTIPYNLFLGPALWVHSQYYRIRDQSLLVWNLGYMGFPESSLKWILILPLYVISRGYSSLG